MRPEELSAQQRPVPNDEWDDEDEVPELLPLEEKPSGVSGEDRKQTQTSTEFQTPSSDELRVLELAYSLPPQEPEHDETKPPSSSEMEQAAQAEGPWKRRTQRNVNPSLDVPTNSKGDQQTGSGLEEALGVEMIKHFQDETAKLRQQNEQLMQTILHMQNEKRVSVQEAPRVPTSWGKPNEPKTPPRVSPPSTNDSQMWMTPDSVRKTPGGTMLPVGPPPPSPPPVPEFPVDFDMYDGYEQPRKWRGIMGSQTYRVAGENHSPRAARTRWLEKEVEDLQELLYQQAMSAKPMPGYWHTPFMSDAARASDNRTAVDRMLRNAGLPPRDSSHVATDGHVLGGDRDQVRAGSAAAGMHELGGDRDGARASGAAAGMHELGGDRERVRANLIATGMHDLGDVFAQDRAAWAALARDRPQCDDRAPPQP